MKLLVVVPCYYPATRYGGPIKSIHELCKNLVRLGVDVTVFTTNIDGPADLSVPCGVELDLDGVRVFYFPVRHPRNYFRSPALGDALRKRVKAFDLVYIAWLYVYTTAAAARECLRQDVPYVLSPRGMLDRAAIALKGSIKKRLYLTLVERPHIDGAAAIHFTSLGEKDHAIAVGSAVRSFVVPNGIDVSEYERPKTPYNLSENLSLPRDKRIVLFLGRLNYIKGLDVLTKAWPRVVASVPSAHLVLAGADDVGLYRGMHRSLEKRGLGHSVSYVGMVHGHHKIALIWEAEVLVAPSYLESFGMAIVEAMACNRPVVITDRVNISKEIDEARAGFVTRCDPVALADAIVRVLVDPELASRMGAAGRTLIDRQFTLDNAACAMHNAFRLLMETRDT